MKKGKKILWITMLIICMFLLFPTSSVNASSKKPVLSKTSITLTLGGKTKQDLNLNGVKQSKVTWKTRNKKVATVDKNGKVVAKKAGKTTIIAKVKGKKKQYKCTVYVKSTKISQSSLTLEVGKSKTLTLKDSIKNKKISKNLNWSTNKYSVATVENGRVVAKAVGKAKITVYVKGKKNETKRTCKVTVKAATQDNNNSDDKNDNGSTEDSKSEGETKDGVTETTTNDGKFKVTITAPSAPLKANGTHDFHVTIANSTIVSDQEVKWRTSGNLYIGEIDNKTNIFTARDVDGEMDVYCSVKGKDKNGKSVSCMSNKVKVKVETGYTYEMYALSNFYNGGYRTEGVVSSGSGAVYIKTNRDDLTDASIGDLYFVLMDDNGTILNYAEKIYTHRFDNVSGYSANSTSGGSLSLDKCRIEDGFTARVHLGGPKDASSSNKMESGTYNLALVKEVVSGVFAPLATLKIQIYDTDQLFKDWANYFLDNFTTASMSNHDKMISMVEFMDSYYYNNSLGNTHDVGLSFVSGGGGSDNTPSVLLRFGKEVLGYSELTTAGNHHGEVIVLNADGSVKYSYYVANGVESTQDSIDRKMALITTLQDLINTFSSQELVKVYENVPLPE